MNIRFEIEYRTIYGEDLFLNVLERDGSQTRHAMHTRDGIIWTCELTTEKPLEYFYTVTWQGREKRTEWVFCPHSFDPKEVSDPSLPVVQRDAWMDAPEDFRVAGTLIHVFSLRSRRSFGVGDFGDLRMMVDWVATTGQRLLQILPINDTTSSHTWADSYPYSCISVFALHPQYVELGALPKLKKVADRERFEALRLELNALPQVDYERVNAAKLEYLQLLFQQEGKKVLASAEFKEFFAESQDWLVPYAQYCSLRDHFGTGDFSQWPEEYRQYKVESSKLKVESCLADKGTGKGQLSANQQGANQQGGDQQGAAQLSTLNFQLSTPFWYFVQFILAQQLSAVHAYARTRGVILKGDIPIGVARHGCDVWQEPRYFNLNGQAGAPPDPFSADGQNWGFPTYNWDEMLADGCQWWVRRFRKMAEYFDAYRIDHVLGFFRIWEIPMPHKSGLMGQFSPALGFSKEEIESYGVTFNEGLFLVDHKRSDRWHPRIAVQYQEAYEQLSEGQKFYFNRLYNDYFYNRNNHFWYQEAMKKLPRLTQATRMLVCAEDLGMVPDCVPWVMNELRILSLEIQSMPKDSKVRFGHLSMNPYRSVCTISTHDMPTLRQWWDEDMERTQDYFSTMLYRGGEAPHPLPGWLAKEIVSRHLTCPSMLCLLSLQDWLSIDDRLRLPDQNAERINIPANPRHYWRYRMHLTIEQLLAADDFNNEISTLITQSGRK